MRQKWLPTLGRSGGAIVVVALLTLVFVRLTVNATTAALAFMLVVLGTATVWGLAEALVTAAAATLSLDYFFFQPTGFSVASRNDVIALAAFRLRAGSGTNVRPSLS